MFIGWIYNFKKSDRYQGNNKNLWHLSAKKAFQYASLFNITCNTLTGSSSAQMKWVGNPLLDSGSVREGREGGRASERERGSVFHLCEATILCSRGEDGREEGARWQNSQHTPLNAMCRVNRNSSREPWAASQGRRGHGLSLILAYSFD